MKDARLVELDQIVAEVRESEEWEAVKMDLIDIGINKGIHQGIIAIIETCRDLNVSKQDTQNRIIDKFNLSKEKADEYMNQYWKP